MRTLLFPLIFAVLSSAKQLMRCKACEKLAEQVQKRMDETGKRGGQVTVGHRFGPNGESVHKKVIDYANSENRYMDVFEDSLCKENPHKSECFEIFDDNESNFHEWFFKAERPDFMEHFCFKELKGCSRNILEEEAKKEEESKVKVEKDEAKKSTEGSSEPKVNQIVMNPDAELKATHPEVFENLQKHHTQNAEKEPCRQCSFQSPKDLIAPLIVAIMIAIGFAAWYIVLENRKEDSEVREPLKRPKRRTSVKNL